MSKKDVKNANIKSTPNDDFVVIDDETPGTHKIMIYFPSGSVYTFTVGINGVVGFHIDHLNHIILIEYDNQMKQFIGVPFSFESRA